MFSNGNVCVLFVFYEHKTTLESNLKKKKVKSNMGIPCNPAILLLNIHLTANFKSLSRTYTNTFTSWLNIGQPQRYCGLVPDHHNKVSITIKQITNFFGFPVLIKVMFTLFYNLLSVQ